MPASSSRPPPERRASGALHAIARLAPMPLFASLVTACVTAFGASQAAVAVNAPDPVTVGATTGAIPRDSRADASGATRVHPLVLLELDDTRLRFSALGRDWDITLAPRSLLSPAARADLDGTGVPRFLGGRVVGDERSWVRLARHGARLSGHLYADGALYRIEPPSGDDGYRLILVGTGIGDLDVAPSGEAPTRARDGVPLVSRAMRVGIVVDSLYDERSDGRGLERALGIMNGVDGLYRDQLGLAVVVERVRLHDDPGTDPMRSHGGTVEDVLNAFREVRRNDPGLPDDLALVHLFSGHEDPDEVIGLGWIDTACRLDGYDVSMSTPFPYDTLLSAHEIAHNLGALHDEDPRCRTSYAGASVGGLMEERLSGSSAGEFSACSLEHLRRTLGASCLVDSLDLALEVRASPGPGERRHLVAVRVANEDPWRTARAVRTRTRFPAGIVLAEASAGCTVDGAVLDCRHGDVAPEATGTISVLATLPAVGADGDGERAAGELDATIVAGTFVDSRPGNDRVVLELRPSNAPDGATAPVAAAPGETGGTLPTRTTADGATSADTGPFANTSGATAAVDGVPVADDAGTRIDAGGGRAGGGAGAVGRALVVVLGAGALVRRRAREPQRSRSTE